MSDPDATPVSPPRRTWRRRFLRLFLLLTGVLVVGRILLALTMPWIVDAVAGSLGCRCEYERFSLSILAGDMEIWHLTLTPEAGGHPLCNLEYACVDVAVTRLLTGSIEVRRLEVDGVDIYLDRAADGTAPVLELARKLLSGTPPTPEPPESGDPADPIDLTAPVSVVAARMQHTHIHLRDRFTTPPVEARLDLNVRISHIGDADQPARFQIMAASPTLLDILRFEGKVSSAGRTVDLSAAFHMAGLHLKPLAPYLGAFGATPVADSMNASANVAVETRPVSSPEGCLRGFFEVRNARADADGRTFAWMKQFRFQVNAFGPAVPDGIADARFHADLGPITLTGIEAEVTRDPSGSWIVACLGLGAVPADPSILPAVFPQQEPTGKAREPERGAPVAETPPPSRPFLQGALSALEVNGATLRFRDASTSPPVAVDLTVPAFSIRDLALGGRAKEPGAIVEGRLEAPGLWKAAVLKGNLGHLPDRLALSFDATVKGVEPEALKPYLEALGAETVMKDGALTCRVDGSAGRSPGGYITGNLDVTDLRFTAAGESMSLARFAVAGLEADLKTNHFHLGRVDVTGGRIRVRREATGMLWIPGMRFGLPGRTHPRPEEAAPSPVPAGPDRTVQGRLGLGHLHVADHQVLFIDEAVTPPTTLSLVDAGLEMRDLTLVFGPEATATPAARVRGAMKLPGLAGPPPDLKRQGLDAVVGHHLARPVHPYHDQPLAQGAPPILPTPMLGAHGLAEHPLEKAPDGSFVTGAI